MSSHDKKFRFTNRAIEQLPICPANGVSKSVEYSDSEVIGLRISINKSGRRFWFWRYTYQGVKRAAKIGEFPALDVAAARRRALDLRAQLDLGQDPQASKDHYKSMPTLAEFAEREYMPLARQTKRSHADDASRLKHHLLPRFGQRKLCDLTTREIQGFIAELAKSHAPATANRILSLLARMLKLATVWQIIDRNPCQGIAKFREARARERFLSNDEIARLYRAMALDKNTVAVSAIQLLLLTGLRRNEALKAKWHQVDLDRQLMHLPETKAGKPRNVVLSAQAVVLLAGLPSRNSSEWLFPGRFGDRPLDNLDKCLRRLLLSAGIAAMRVHDFRHTHASILANNGVSLFVIQRSLGHSSPLMSQRYSHLCDSAVREAGDVVGNVVSQARESQQGP